MGLILYDEEQKKIRATVAQTQMKYHDRPFTYANLHEMHKELTGKLNDLGFDVTVDVTPLFEYKPVDVVINSRLSGEEFDHDKKRDEILKSRKQGGI